MYRVLSVLLNSPFAQQLAKLLYSGTSGSMLDRIYQKPNEWVIAVNLEQQYTKNEILTMYLNKYDFGYNAVGLASAAGIYFGKQPGELTIEEGAMLVGMCKNSSLYNPRTRPDMTRGRRNVVLSQMEKAGYITEAERDSLSALPLVLNYRAASHNEGIATYFREYLRLYMTAKKPERKNYRGWQMQQYYDDSLRWATDSLFGWCNRHVKPNGEKYNIYTDGLKIYTTIDSRMQQYAEEAVSEHMQDLQKSFFREKRKKSYAPFSKDLTPEEIDGIMNRSMRQTDRYRALKKQGMNETAIKQVFNTPVNMRVFSYNGLIDTTMTPMDSIRWNKHFLRCGFMSMDAHSGAVKAYVGGPNFAHFQYDMVSTGRRQVGSTIKPYLFTLAMDEGMWPCDSTVNDSITLIDGNGVRWTPRDEHLANQGEMVTLNWGLEKSSNWITAYLMSLFTPEQLVRMMRSFGIEGQLDPVVSLCLGPCEVSVKEMVDAYTTFPNKGIRVEPLYVTRIEDNNGNILATFTPKTYEVKVYEPVGLDVGFDAIEKLPEKVQPVKELIASHVKNDEKAFYAYELFENEFEYDMQDSINCCNAAFLRGAFLSCGTCSDPNKSYHIEFIAPYRTLSLDLLKILTDYGLKAKHMVRRYVNVIYIKDSTSIEELLTLMGAPFYKA